VLPKAALHDRTPCGRLDALLRQQHTYKLTFTKQLECGDFLDYLDVLTEKSQTDANKNASETDSF